uniref:ATP-dependent Clp protease proteolytic subunit n=1 Tax=Carteria sp. SAG 8-5 TaxID=1756294 RepID=A0A0S2LPP3_9CHLO|nr:proteolytic subunit 2 of clp protease [Carteria sp. SAG 8-5]
MPIGVPRIIYCWGEELPAQWTDIYNFIFRRRMIFLMQYLDDELCNQICGLLINIHMEDRAKDLEKKEMENSGLFKGSKKTAPPSVSNLQNRSVEDLLKSEDDLAIDENYKLEQYTLQKITMEWLNWNAQFFDYADEPYLFYLAEILSKSFNDTKQDANLLHSNWRPSGNSENGSSFDVYAPFRIFSDIDSTDFNLKELSQNSVDMIEKFKQIQKQKNSKGDITSLLSNIANKELWEKIGEPQNILKSSEKALGQRRLRKEYTQQKSLKAAQALNLVNPSVQQLLDFQSSDSNSNEFREYYRKQTERAFQDEESKKVFMIINSFGGSVGNGITVHDALQFIKAGSLTLALGVAASAASLALAGGTIGERYVTEGCHVMIHQPEGGLSGQASDIWIDSQEIMKIRQEVANIYSLSTYRPRHKILRDLDRDFYLTATETVYYGLADEIASNEVMHEIIEMTSKVWDYHDTKQQRLLESRDSANSGVETQTQN